MKSTIRLFFVGLTAICFAGSAVSQEASTVNYAVYDSGLLTVVKGVRWSQAKSVDFEFDGETERSAALKLESGQPYSLKLRNVGSSDVELSFPELMRTAAVKGLEVGPVSLVAPRFERLMVAAGGAITIQFVPTESGEFDVMMIAGDQAVTTLEKILVESPGSTSKKRRRLRR